jgi:FkbM family methyltransferase
MRVIDWLRLPTQTSRVLRTRGGFGVWFRTMTLRRQSLPLALERLLGIVKVTLRDGRTWARFAGEQFALPQVEGSDPRRVLTDVIGQWREAAYLDKYNARLWLKPGMTVLDLGACYGAFSIVAARSVGPEGTVVAVEPIEDNLRCLEDNVAVRALQNVVPLLAAVGDRDGELTLHLGNRMGGHSAVMLSGGREVAVPMRSIDSLVAELGLGRVDLIKSDVEGMEPELLRGAAETIRRFRPHLVISAYHLAEHRSLLPAILLEIDPGYRITVEKVCHGSELEMYASPMSATVPRPL